LDVRPASSRVGDLGNEIMHGLAIGNSFGVVVAGLGYMRLRHAVARVAGAQASAPVIRARIQVTVENRQVSDVITAVKVITYGIGAAKTGAAVKAARERRAT
jgi:hypothetical protein